jgi:hypothetical protein
MTIPAGEAEIPIRLGLKEKKKFVYLQVRRPGHYNLQERIFVAELVIHDIEVVVLRTARMTVENESSSCVPVLVRM